MSASVATPPAERIDLSIESARVKVRNLKNFDCSPQAHTQSLGRSTCDGQRGRVTGCFCFFGSASVQKISETLKLKAHRTDPLVNPDLADLAPLASEGGRIRRLAEDLLRQRGGQR